MTTPYVLDVVLKSFSFSSFAIAGCFVAKLTSQCSSHLTAEARKDLPSCRPIYLLVFVCARCAGTSGKRKAVRSLSCRRYVKHPGYRATMHNRGLNAPSATSKVKESGMLVIRSHPFPSSWRNKVEQDLAGYKLLIAIPNRNQFPESSQNCTNCRSV